MICALSLGFHRSEAGSILRGSDRAELDLVIINAYLDRMNLEILRQIYAADRQIDELVYELYDRTPDEIAVVGGQK